MVVSLTNYPMVATITKHFVVTISCEVTSITFSLAPGNIFVEPGVTTQPAYKSFDTTQFPNCGHTIAYAWVTAPPAFVTKDYSTKKVAVGGVDITKQGIYNLTLRATVDSKYVDASFTVEISDPCKRAVFQATTTSPLTKMNFILDYNTSDLV